MNAVTASCSRKLGWAALAIVCAVSSPLGAQPATNNAKRPQAIVTQALQPLDEAQQRRTRSTARLAADYKIFVPRTLPTIKTAMQTRQRSADDIARRAVALWMVAVKGATGNSALVARLLHEYGAPEDFTAKERAFIGSVSPSMDQRIQFSWRYEALNVLLWATGFVPTLGRPDRPVDVAALAAIFHDNGRRGLLAKSRLRPIGEILDQADLIYRTHWAVREAEARGKAPPAGLDASVVLERHHALNWLITYAGQGWDEVTTDT